MLAPLYAMEAKGQQERGDVNAHPKRKCANDSGWFCLFSRAKGVSTYYQDITICQGNILIHTPSS
jgi:hypothetical protein